MLFSRENLCNLVVIKGAKQLLFKNLFPFSISVLVIPFINNIMPKIVTPSKLVNIIHIRIDTINGLKM